RNAAGVLLAHLEFLARLEGPSLPVLKEALKVRLRSDEIADDEAIDFLRYQLAIRQSQEAESRLRPLILRSLAILGVVGAVVIGTSLAIHYAKTPNFKMPDEGSVPSEGSVRSTDKASPAIAPQPQRAPARIGSGATPPAVPEPPKPQVGRALTTPAP